MLNYVDSSYCVTMVVINRQFANIAIKF
jgi:hypothetical protein